MVYAKNGGVLLKRLAVRLGMDQFSRSAKYFGQTANIPAKRQVVYAKNGEVLLKRLAVRLEMDQFSQNGKYFGQTANISAKRQVSQPNGKYFGESIKELI